MGRTNGHHAARRASLRLVSSDERSIYEAHRGAVLGVLARRCGWLDPDEREAIMHDAYLVLLEKRRTRELDPGSMPMPQLRAYLIQTAIYKALDVGKSAERRLAEPVGDGAILEGMPDPRRGPDVQAEANEQGARVRRLVAELPTRQHAIVTLRYLLDYSPAEIQACLGITRRTYRRQLERAMSTMADRCVRASLREAGERSSA